MGWSPDAVSEALRRWCAEHAGRDDVTFTYRDNLVSPFLEHAVAIAQAGGESYDLRDGVFASEQAMDAFVADPDAAAAILSELKLRRGDG